MNTAITADEIRELYSEADPAHDFGHILRVYNNCHSIAQKEPADPEVLFPAAWLHDVGCGPKIPGKTSNDGSLRIAKDFLETKGFDSDLIEKILYAIGVHSFSKGVVPESLEAKVLQDADRLDAIGAVGIGRVFLVGGSLGREMYKPEDPFCRNREPDDRRWLLDHFFTKLLKLEEGMHTKTAQELAKKRTKVLRRFLADLKDEIEIR